MKEFELSLKMFREERGLITPNFSVTKKMAHEELQEVLTAKTLDHAAEEMCDVCIVIYNYLAQKGEQYISDQLADSNMKNIAAAVEFCVNCLDTNQLSWIIDSMRDCITLNGYDFDKAMLETANKINSREGAMNTKTLKWEKSKTQDKSTLYTPNYDKCKL